MGIFLSGKSHKKNTPSALAWEALLLSKEEIQFWELNWTQVSCGTNCILESEREAGSGGKTGLKLVRVKWGAHKPRERSTKDDWWAFSLWSLMTLLNDWFISLGGSAQRVGLRLMRFACRGFKSSVPDILRVGRAWRDLCLQILPGFF